MNLFLRARGEQGFTLIEVLIALTILSMSLAVLLGAFSQSLARAKEAERQMAARTLAQSLLAEVRPEAIARAADATGTTADGLSWRVHAVPVAGLGDPLDPLTPVAVTATVSWPQGDKTRTLSLKTLRLLPNRSAP